MNYLFDFLVALAATILGVAFWRLLDAPAEKRKQRIVQIKHKLYFSLVKSLNVDRSTVLKCLESHDGSEIIQAAKELLEENFPNHAQYASRLEDFEKVLESVGIESRRYK